MAEDAAGPDRLATGDTGRGRATSAASQGLWRPSGDAEGAKITRGSRSAGPSPALQSTAGGGGSEGGAAAAGLGGGVAADAHHGAANAALHDAGPLHAAQHRSLHQQGFVQPSSYLHRPHGNSTSMAAPEQPQTPVDREQQRGLRSIRNFLRVRNSYDVLPMSFRLIMLDTRLLVKSSLNILSQNGIVSAPLWDSKTSTFAGLLTTSDYINVIQYYCQNPDAIKRIDSFRLDSLRDIEKSIGVAPIEAISIHPSRPLYEACTRMLETRARRIPLVDIDDDTKRPMVCSVITQYRILKFIAVNVTDTQLLQKPIRQIKIGTTRHLETCRMDTPVITVINQMVRRNISCVPVLNTDGVVVNVFEAVDVIYLIKGHNYEDLAISVGEALQKRSADFPGIYTCSPDDRLDIIFDTLRKARVHRFVIIDGHSRLVGILSLSDILEYALLDAAGDEPRQ